MPTNNCRNGINWFIPSVALFSRVDEAVAGSKLCQISGCIVCNHPGGIVQSCHASGIIAYSYRSRLSFLPDLHINYHNQCAEARPPIYAGVETVRASRHTPTLFLLFLLLPTVDFHLFPSTFRFTTSPPPSNRISVFSPDFRFPHRIIDYSSDLRFPHRITQPARPWSRLPWPLTRHQLQRQ